MGEISAEFPFLRRVTRVTPARLREVESVAPTDLQTLARIVVTRVAIPDATGSDEDVLRETVRFISRKDLVQQRVCRELCVNGSA